MEDCERFVRKANDGVELQCYHWPVEEPRAVVVLVHGMAEHALRYGAFARRLNDAGFAAAALDLRGHGRMGQGGLRGDFGPGGWRAVVEDVHDLCRWAGEQYPGRPVALFGHSMGSMFACAAMETFGSELGAVALCGVTVDLPVRRAVAPAIARVLGALQGRQKPSAPLHAMTFGAFNKAFRPTRTPFDWLSRDPAEVDDYAADADCGYACTAAFYEQVARMLLFTLRGAHVERIPRALPILLVSGGDDPVGNFGDAGRALLRQYQQMGLCVRLILYPQARHVLLGETNRDEVMGDLVDFYQDAL